MLTGGIHEVAIVLLCRLAVVLTTALVFGQTASGQPMLIGCSSYSGFNPADATKIVRVSMLDGSTSNTVNVPIRVLGGIAADPATGEVFGLGTLFSGSAANSLIKIDANTGSFTVVGNTGIPGIVEGDLAFDPVTHDLFGIQGTGVAGTERNLFAINPQTGAGSIIGYLGNSGNTADYSALAFSPAGVLYAIDTGPSGFSRLLTINTANGQVLTSMNMDVHLGGGAGMAFHPLTGEAFVADTLAAPVLGTNSVYLLNASTGTTQLLGPTGLPDGLSGLTFVSIPEPSSVLLTMTAVAAWVPYIMGRRFNRNRCLRVGESELHLG